MNVPYADLRAQYHSIKPEIDEAVLQLLDSTQFVLGSRVAAFEDLFAPYCHAAHAAGSSSGTSALHLALLALGVGPGDEVITTPHTFIATAAAIGYCGAHPVFVDIDPVSFNIDVSKIEPAITPNTKAIVPVHLYGQPADMDPILEIATRRGLGVVEDAAQAHGAEYRGRRVGSIGDLGCFSFYPGKNLGAYGEGGAVTTNSAELDEAVRVLRDWGAREKHHHEVKGFNYRLEGIQGAVLAVKMAHIERWTEARRVVAARYDESLAGSAVVTPHALPDRRHVYHVYSVRSDDRDALAAHLSADGIASGIHYPTPVHLQPAFAELGHGRGDFPEAEAAAASILSLPMYPEMPVEFQERVAESIHAWSAK
ncbi:DegT/DnrJ/EryC1/StrS family aminotransferase [Ilumatobacter coccineus]|uniref:Putative aminotransferase n=1 Tax=Ilumatobacter coccineus (strain NBRC 103263 / KCTC 29153 / YM16-304) TaxID=1313172 RepID=A0A6C7EAU4_ILUCY|nr:DegT/DnrJ/EryC1/StrS family aminotransferase [Ilumatobacter coccineus]BAN01758.1 putative aminotransferase [Ilumatobacter coccineus YM16-304]